jgi:hypothetical protein
VPVRVLIVDDDALTRRVLVKVLRAEGCDATGTGSGAEALEHLRAGPHDVLITDLVMPGMSGLELISAARTLPYPLRIIIISGAQRSEQALPEDVIWLAKPLDADLLIEAIRAP